MEKRKSLKNQRKMNKKNITMKQYGLKDKAKTNIVETFMGILNMVKLYHWKTYSYAKHQATDELYMKFVGGTPNPVRMKVPSLLGLSATFSNLSEITDFASQ